MVLNIYKHPHESYYYLSNESSTSCTAMINNNLVKSTIPHKIGRRCSIT